MAFEVEMKYKDGRTEVLKNITEIHYNYPSVLSGIKVAFESGIEQTGRTHNIDDIEEFEATLQPVARVERIDSVTATIVTSLLTLMIGNLQALADMFTDILELEVLSK